MLRTTTSWTDPGDSPLVISDGASVVIEITGITLGQPLAACLGWIARQFDGAQPPAPAASPPAPSPAPGGSHDPHRETGYLILKPDQLDRLGELKDHWSFLWDKRRSLWIAAEDSPDGDQFEEPDLDVLLALLPAADAEGC